MGRIITIVTVFHPTVKHVNNIIKMAKQSDLTLVCDNSDDSNSALFETCKEQIRIIYLANHENLGLSGAFNRVLRQQNERFDWKEDDIIVFFDQDSLIPEGHISRLVDEYTELVSKGFNVGFLGPVFYNNSNHTVEKPRLYKTLTQSSIEVGSIMTSSMLCLYRTLKDIGYWNEEVFLDLADWDICWRARKKGYICVMSSCSILNHTVGEGERRIGPFSLRVAKPFREYYETRDCLYLLKKDYVPFKDRVRFHLMLTVRPLMHLLFLDRKKERKYYIKLGVRHYKERIFGRLPDKEKWIGEN